MSDSDNDYLPAKKSRKFFKENKTLPLDLDFDEDNLSDTSVHIVQLSDSDTASKVIVKVEVHPPPQDLDEVPNGLSDSDTASEVTVKVEDPPSPQDLDEVPNGLSDSDTASEVTVKVEVHPSPQDLDEVPNGIRLGEESNRPTTTHNIQQDLATEDSVFDDSDSDLSGFSGFSETIEFPLKYFSCFKELFQNVTSDSEKALLWLQEQKLIPADGIKCPKCAQYNRNGVLKYHKDSSRKAGIRLHCSGVGKRCRIKVSPFTNTFFDGFTCRIDICKVIEIIYFWLSKYPVNLATKESGVCHASVIDYYNYCREVCGVSLSESFESIGGPGKIVEIDESKFFKRKYRKSTLLGSQQDGWVFGGIQRDNKNIFMVRVPRRDKETLLPLIGKFIKPGTLIISDERRAYSELSREGYDHATVCHKTNFVSPTDPTIHTQNIGISWRYAKRTYPDNSTSEELKDSYLQEFLYRRKYSNNLVTQFFKDIRIIYKHPLL